MNVWCEICGKQWDSRDHGIRYWYGEGDWSCDDTVACFDRLHAQFDRFHMQRALNSVAAPLRVVE